jgi:hypothetical protein
MFGRNESGTTGVAERGELPDGASPELDDERQGWK